MAAISIDAGKRLLFNGCMDLLPFSPPVI